MKVREALSSARRRLAGAGVSDAALEAEVLLMYAAGVTREQLYAGLADPAPQGMLQRFEALVERRLRREPLAYVTGHREFFGLDFLVDRRVLVPNPDTEPVVEQALAIARREFPDGACRIADVGTGSGAIAVSLAVNLPHARVYAIDVDPAALEVADLNRRLHGVHHRVVLVQGDLLAPLAEPVDMVVANLPYVSEGEWDGLDPELRFEPRHALIAGPNGLEVIERLVRQVLARPAPVPWLVLEIGDGIAPEAPRRITTLVREQVPGAGLQVFKDLGGLDRCLVVGLAPALARHS